MPGLTALKVKNAKPGRHSDGNGLCLLVKPSGAKSWMLRVQHNGRRRDYGLGSADLLSLSDAREKARQWRLQAREGLDPAKEAKRRRQVQPTFEEAARQYHAEVKKGWRNGKHKEQWLNTLVAYAFPKLGDQPVDRIDVEAIRSVLSPIWLEIPETARRVRQRIASVLDFAHGEGWRPAEAPMRAVAKGLPRQPRRTRHFAALPYAHAPALYRRLKAEEATAGRLGLLFTMLTAGRSGEVRGATWGEIDLARRLWSIPADRMKASEEHQVPLSDLAVDVLVAAKALGAYRADDHLFPGLDGRRLSENTLAKVLRMAGGGSATVHGLRSTFRDWAAEDGRFAGELAESALAHAVSNKVEAAYRRTRYVEQRRPLMAAWGAFLASDAGAVSLVA